MFNVCYEILNPSDRFFTNPENVQFVFFLSFFRCRLSNSKIIHEHKKLYVSSFPYLSRCVSYYVSRRLGGPNVTVYYYYCNNKWFISLFFCLAHSFTPTTESATAAVQLAHDRS